MMRQKDEAFAPAEAYHIGSSLASNASTINAQQVRDSRLSKETEYV